MSDIDVLRELAVGLRRPAYDDLVAVSRRRRRRTAAALAAGAAAVVLAAGIAGAALTGEQRTVEPARDPTPAPASGEEWTLDRLRSEGTPRVLVPPTGSGPRVRELAGCVEPACREERRALEITQGGRTALFEVGGALPGFVPVWVTVLDRNAVLVQDAADGLTAGPVRFRVLRADGTALELEPVDDPAAAVPGPGVVAVDAYHGWSAGLDRGEDLYLVDAAAGTVRPVAVPDGEVDWWGPNVEEFLWGLGAGCRAHWVSDGRVREHRLPCRGDWRPPAADDFPTGWLRPGRMAGVEWFGTGQDGVYGQVVHVSLDAGTTWRRIPTGRVDEDEPADDGVAEALRRLDDPGTGNDGRS